MDNEARGSFRFETYEIDLDLFELRNTGLAVRLEPQVFDVLAYLVQNRDRVVGKQELFENVWQDAFVGEAALSTRIMEARKAIGDTGTEQRLIRTIRSRGYRFVGDVTVVGGLRGSNNQSQSQSSDEASLDPVVAPADSTPRIEATIPIGRAEEMDQLQSAWERVCRGERQFVMIAGEPGIGKSTLVNAFSASLRPHALMIEGECIEYAGDKEPYMPVITGLTRAGRSMGGAELVDALSRLAPTWLLQLPRLIDAQGAEDLRFRSLGSTTEGMLRQFEDALVQLSSEKPAVLIIEDLHWADSSTVGLIQWLAQRREQFPLLVVGTFRSRHRTGTASIETVVGALSARSMCELITLGPLNTERGRELIQDQLQVDCVPFELCKTLVERADGNPLFMKAIVEDWLFAGHIVVEGGTCTVKVDHSELVKRVPSSIGLLIEATAANLPPAARQVLEVASVVGTSFSVDDVAIGTNLRITEAESACEDLARTTGYLRRSTDSSAGYSFVHSLHREVVYEKIAAERRAELHGLLGQRLEQLGIGEDTALASQLANHFSKSRQPEKAITYLKLVAEKAVERSAFNEAYNATSTALQLLRQLPDSKVIKHTELELLQTFANVAVAISGWSAPEVEESLVKAEALARELGDEKVLALALYGLATMRELLGQYEASEELLSAQLEIVNSGLKLEARELLACSTFHQGKFSEALNHAAIGLETYEPLKHHSPHMARYGENLGVSTNTWAALSLWFVGKGDEAVVRSDLAIEYATDQVYSLTTAQIQRAFLHQFRLEPEQCLTWALATKETALKHGFPFRLVQADFLAAWARIELQLADVSLTDLVGALNAYEDFGAALDTPYFEALVAEQELKHEEPGEALRRLDGALKHLGPAGKFFYEPEIRRLQALAHEMLEMEIDSVKRLLVAAEANGRYYGALPLQLRSALELYRIASEPGEKASTAAAISKLLTAFESGLSTPDLQIARAAISPK